MIGIFDSGVGGLTVYRQIRVLAPNADIVYFGDTANAPYGNKTSAEVGALTILAVQKLLSLGATDFVSACNSISASVALPLFEVLRLPQHTIIEMVPPTVDHFVTQKKTGRILLVATQLTIDSGMYQKAFAHRGITINALPIPALAGAIERGVSREEIKNIVARTLTHEYILGIDILLLGCTHFPLVTDVFREVIGDDIEIYDPAYAVAQKVVSQFQTDGTGLTTFVFSQENEVTRTYLENLLVENKK